VLAGVGSSVPVHVVTNDDLAARLDTSDEWIRSRTGIVTRHVVAPGVATSDLAVEAGGHALKSAGRENVDVVIVATTTPDRQCPATAPAVAARLGLGHVPAFDVNAVCSGFVYGLATAAGMLGSGLFGSALLIGADTFSTILDHDDRSTAFLFGDGAGAVVLRAGEPDEPGALLALDMGADGDLEDLIIVPDGGARNPDGPADRFAMQGQAVYRQAVARMTETTKVVLEKVGWTPEDVDLFVGHQANQRILDAVAGRLGLPLDRVYSNLGRVGNTAAASIPLALSDAVGEGRLDAGDKVALAAFGGGATWGGAALTWPGLRAR
jgi:3-oxoacyl-[acyl-carrier-protein] synthase-3